MPDKEKIQDLRGKCVCTRCPTYNACAAKKNELLFCISGKSACKPEKFGCVCGMCPVEKELGFGGMYFCTEGKVKLQ